MKVVAKTLTDLDAMPIVRLRFIDEAAIEEGKAAALLAGDDKIQSILFEHRDGVFD